MIRVLDGFVLALAGLVLSDLLLWWWRPEDLGLVLLGAIALRALLSPYPVPDWKPERVVAAGVVGYAGLFSFITVTRHWAFRTHALDLGFYVQELWSMSRGFGPRVSLPEMHAWGSHLDPILYLFVPVAWVAPGPVPLLIAQSVLLGLGAVPLYLLALPRVGAGNASALAVLYLLNPSLHGLNIRDFHTAAFAIPLLLTAMYAAESRRLWLFWAATLLTLATREDAAIPVVGLGLWLALARRQWAWGGSLALGSLAWLFVEVHWVVPFFRGEPYPYLEGRWGHLGNSLTEVLLSPVLRPGAILALATSFERWRYLLAMLATLGFLPLVAPLGAIGAVPALAQNLLSTHTVLFHHRTQYQSFVLPFLLAGAVAGLEALQRRRRLAWLTPARVLSAAMLVSLALTARTVNDLAVRQWWLNDRQAAAHRLLARVPPGVSVSAGERFVPHLAQRAKIFVFPLAAHRSDYAFVDGSALSEGRIGRTRATRVGDVVTLDPGDVEGGGRAAFSVVAEDAGIMLLRRVSE